MKYKVTARKIDWDVDVPIDLDNLPTEVTMEVEIEEDEEDTIDLIVGEYLSDVYGFCHNGFLFDKTPIQ